MIVRVIVNKRVQYLTRKLCSPSGTPFMDNCAKTTHLYTINFSTHNPNPNPNSNPNPDPDPNPNPNWRDLRSDEQRVRIKHWSHQWASITAFVIQYFCAN